MRQITAVLHTHNDGLRLGRCLETLYPCDEILVVDYGSSDDTLHVARDYGAKVVAANTRSSHVHLAAVRTPWILCLDARESLTEALAASIYEWKTELGGPGTASFSALLREETAQGWIQHSVAETRLVPVKWDRWEGSLPQGDPGAGVLQGEILRFSMP